MPQFKVFKHLCFMSRASDTMDALRHELEEWGVEMVYHIGDLSYANGRTKVWDTFMEGIEPVASKIPYMVGIGNHEYDWKHQSSSGSKDPSGATRPYDPDWGNFGNDSGGECGVAAAMRFTMPGTDGSTAYWWSGSSGNNATKTGPCENPSLSRRGTASVTSPACRSTDNIVVDLSTAAVSNSPFWYAFSVGPVRFVTLSTEHDLSKHSRQYEWLVAELRSVNRCKTPWLVVGMHRPMYVVFPHKSNRVVGEHLRHQLEPLFNRYEVDLVLSGHVHSYSRSCNVLDGVCIDPAEGGATHVVAGTGGRKLSFVAADQFDWLEHSEERWGYVRGEVVPSGSLHLEFVSSESTFGWLMSSNI